MKKRAMYPGTFDPITHGHSDLIRRASQLFDEVIVAVAGSVSKAPLLDIDSRMSLVKQVLSDCSNLTVIKFDNLLVDCAREYEVQVIIRGLRAVTDFEYEYQLVGMNRCLNPDLETIFLAAKEKYSYISASLVREVATMGGDLSHFVAPEVIACLQDKVS